MILVECSAGQSFSSFLGFAYARHLTIRGAHWSLNQRRGGSALRLAEKWKRKMEKFWVNNLSVIDSPRKTECARFSKSCTTKIWFWLKNFLPLPSYSRGIWTILGKSPLSGKFPFFSKFLKNLKINFYRFEMKLRKSVTWTQGPLLNIPGKMRHLGKILKKFQTFSIFSIFFGQVKHRPSDNFWLNDVYPIFSRILIKKSNKTLKLYSSKKPESRCVIPFQNPFIWI